MIERFSQRGAAARSLLSAAVLAAAVWALPSRAQESAPVKPPPLTAETPAGDTTVAAKADDERPRKRRRSNRAEAPGDEPPAAAKRELPPAMAVTVQGRSKPTLCAEDDNVYVTFSSSTLRHFRIDARPPSAIGAIVVDSTAPDFTDCVIADQPPGPEDKVDRIVLFEDDALQLVGYRHAEFWRKGDVPLKVGDREEHQLHLVQLFVKRPDKDPYEYLVLYPLDGYWRARPLPPERLPQVAYGTSFLVGAVEDKERPVVELKSIKFVPAVKSFELTFPEGDVATVRVTDLSEKAASIEVVMEQPVKGRPFAALRSMFVTEVNADASHVFWKEQKAKGWRTKPVMDFRRAFATEVRLGRVAPSRHNTSAPDTILWDFMPD
ncbi:MAG: hypothetical protein U1E62_00930 [Alsobacter sp.]